jgi:hypothetical protein
MKRSKLTSDAPLLQGRLISSGMILLLAALSLGLWLLLEKQPGTTNPDEISLTRQKDSLRPENRGRVVNNHDEGDVSDNYRSPQSFAGTSRQPLQFRTKAVEPTAVLAVLASGNQTVEERVRQLQGMRGIVFSTEEGESALAFLAGKDVPAGIGKGSMHWLADELLTAMRLQEPPWDGLAKDLAQVAFQPGTDPVVRDYIMQHLGHLWEQHGAREEIDDVLWRVVGTSEETSPGTALIALSRGYKRDQQEKGLAKVRQQALALAVDPNTTLAVRVTALSIAGDGGGAEVKELAKSLNQNPETPVILRKVAERVGQ